MYNLSTPLYDSVLFSIICYLDDNIIGSVVYTFKGFIPLSTYSTLFDYSSMLINYISFFEIDRYVLYKNNYCVEIPHSHKILINMLYNDIYSNNISFSWVGIKMGSMQNAIAVLFICHLIPLFFYTILFLLVIIVCYKMVIFKPFIVFFRKVIWESEQTLVSLEDFFIILSFYFAYIMHFGSIYMPIIKIAFFFYKFNKCLVVFFSVLVGLLPLYFTWKAGAFIFYYIKGVSNDNNTYVTSLNDTMGMLSTLLRYLVQSIRWFLFFLFYFILQLFLYEIKYTLILSDSFSNGYQSNFGLLSGFNTNIFVYISYVVARVWFEILDFLFVAVVQLSAFLVVLFWLLGFLFSSTIPSIFEVIYSSFRFKPSLI